MKSNKRLIAALAALVMLAAGLAGCSSGGAATTAPAASQAPQETQAGSAAPEVTAPASQDALPEFPLKELTTLKLFCCWSWGDVDYENALVKQFEKMTGIHLEYDVAIDSGEDKQSILMASNDWPDMMLIGAAGGNSCTEISQNFGQQGKLVELSQYLDVMPNVKAYYEKYPSARSLFADNDNKVYLFPYLYPYNTIPTGFFYNAKEFEALSLAAPTSVEDIYTAAKALKAKYPDSYPVTSYTIFETLAVWSRVFNTSSTIYYNAEQDAYTFGPFEPNYKSMLEYLNKLYAEELYDPEFSSYEFSGNKWREKLANGQAFISESYVWEMQYENANSVNVLANSIGRGDKVDFKYVKPPKALGKDSKYWGLTTVNPSYGVIVNSGSQYVKECLKLIDWELTDEFKDLLGYGIEGTTYEVKDGKKVFLDTISVNGNEEGKTPLSTYMSWYAGINIYEIYPDPLGWKTNLEKFTGYTMDEMSTWAIWPEAWPMIFPSDVKQQQSEVMTAVKTMVEERSNNFITGALPMDKYDAFVSDLKALGVEDVVKYHNEFYTQNYKGKK